MGWLTSKQTDAEAAKIYSKARDNRSKLDNPKGLEGRNRVNSHNAKVAKLNQAAAEVGEDHGRSRGWWK